MNPVAIDIAHALAEILHGLDFAELREPERAELVKAAKAAMASIEDNREPLDPMRGVEFPFADNH